MKTVLEVGGFERPVQLKGHKIIQADVVDREGVDVTFKWGSDPIPLDDNSLDGFYASHVLEHIEWWKVASALKEARRVIKPGGFIEVHVPDVGKAVAMLNSGKLPTKRSRRLRTRFREFCAVVCWGAPFDEKEAGDYPHWHKTAWTESLLHEQLKAAGFKRICAAAGRPPHVGPGAWHNTGAKGIK